MPARSAVFARKAPWRPSEDEALRAQVAAHGARDWPLVSRALPGRSAKSCRLRWCNHLTPELDRRPFTPREDEAIARAQRAMGNRWATIARLLLPGRSDNAVKNRWNSVLRKRRVPTAAGKCRVLFPLSPQGMGGDMRLQCAGALVSPKDGESASDDARTNLALGLPEAQEVVVGGDVCSPCWLDGFTEES